MSGDAAGARVLVVDDDEDIRDMVRLVLESRGYAVAAAMDGLDALRILDGDAGGACALILLDLMMPRMDGEQFLRTLRERSRAEIPVVIMSGHCAAEEKASALHASGCLRKPVDMKDLMSTVARFCP